MKKRNFLALTTLLLSMGMVACGGTTETKTDDNQNQNQNQNPLPADHMVYGADDKSHWKENEETGKIDSSTRADHEFEAYAGDSRHSPKEPTCSEKGQRFERCKDCGYIRTVEIDTVAHTYVEDASKGTAATCGADGTKVEVCSVCQNEKSTVVPKTGLHAFGEARLIQDKADGNSKTFMKTCTTCSSGIDFYVDAMSYVSLSQGASNKDSTKQTLKFAKNGDNATYKFTVDKKYEGCKVALYGYIDNWKDGNNNNDQKGHIVNGSATFSLKVNGTNVEVTNDDSFEEMGLTAGTGGNSSLGLCYLGGTADLIEGENTVVYTRVASYNMNITEIHFIQ